MGMSTEEYIQSLKDKNAALEQQIEEWKSWGDGIIETLAAKEQQLAEARKRCEQLDVSLKVWMDDANTLRQQLATAKAEGMREAEQIAMQGATIHFGCLARLPNGGQTMSCHLAIAQAIEQRIAQLDSKQNECPHCGPNCLGGAAHFARAEDGVMYKDSK